MLKNEWLESFYDKGIDWVFSHKTLSVVVCLLTIPLCVFMFAVLDKQRMPDIDQNELIVRVEWNENIHVGENNSRVDSLLRLIDGDVIEHTAYVAMQDYVLNTDMDLSMAEAEIYLKTEQIESFCYFSLQIMWKIYTNKEKI